MQQWFLEDQSETNNLPSEKVIDKKVKSLRTQEADMTLLKTFTVEAETRPSQYICVSGNCSSLGNWEVNDSLVLTNTNSMRVENNRTYYVWSGKVHIPIGKEISYRYFLAYILEPDNEYVKQKQVFVHSWESHITPRIVTKNGDNVSQHDVYGLNNVHKISKGFLTTETAVQFKLFDNPITFWKSELQNTINFISIKMTPVALSKHSKLSTDSKENSSCNTGIFFDDSNSQAADDIQKRLGWPFVECVDIPQDYNFKLQNQFGIIIKENVFHLFQTKIHNFGYTGFLFDIYLHKECSDEPPYHVGFSYVLPNNMKYSNGVVITPITSVRHKPIGELKINYLIVKPTKEIHCNLKKMNSIDWKNSYVPLDIGHRGSGCSFKHNESECSNIRENTIASLNEAATKGADYVEFDVQLTKDLVPVIYHDFIVSLATKSKTDILGDNIEMIQIPLKDFSFEQLQKLKIYHVKEPYSLSTNHFLNDVRHDYQPFPKLENAFSAVDINVGFNVELKWTMKLQNGTFELDNPFDMNLFVDTILKTVFKFAKCRNIVLSCFHPDVCTMLKMKQNRYPVLFLTQGVTDRYPPYADPRCHTIQSAIYHATCHDLLGINAHSEDLLRDNTQINMVKEAGLALFCWGDDNNFKEVITKFKCLGVDALIYDKLDKNELKNKQCAAKKNEHYIAENYCVQNGILFSKNQSLNEDMHLRENNDRVGDNNRYFMDIGKAVFQNNCSSTENLWNEDDSPMNNSKLPSRKQRLECNNQSENDSKPTESKKSKSDV